MSIKKNISTFLLVLIAFIININVLQAATVYDIYGKPYSVSMKSNKWIIINYWADWCKYCVEEIPELNKLSTLTKKMPVIFLAVNYDGAPDKVQKNFAAEYNVKFPLLRSNPLESITSSQKISTLPTTFIISPQGEIRKLSGRQTANSILAEIKG